MSRCRCCNTPLVGAVRFKEVSDGQVRFEEDFCNQCIYETEQADWSDVHTYQFEDLTEDIRVSLNIEQSDEIY